ncbi:MAG TPA: nuclear transport factor 2 family protein [Bryobacteraceae bacterium]|nr:nuclear transport factor 2 family protein [Bryobacteraceae bacterium]
MKSAILLCAMMFSAVTAFSQMTDEKKVLEEKAVLAVEHNWLEANKTADSKALWKMLRDDYLEVSLSGQILNKAEALKAADDDAANPKKAGGTQISISAVRVRFYGDVAVLTAAGMVGGPKGTPVRLTHVLVKTQDQWLLTSAQTTRIAPLTTHPPAKIERAH